MLRPPAILIHGAGGDHLFWPPQIRRLDGQRVVAPDLPGHGRSQGLGHHSISDYSRALLEFVDALGLAGFVLVGHSMGGAIALEIACRHPGRVLGLALLGSGARLRVAPELLRSAATGSTFGSAIKLLVDLAFAPEAEPRLKELAARRLAETRPAVLHGDLVACDAFDLRGQVAMIDVPTLLICGAADRLTPAASSGFLKQQIPGARLELVPDAGHMVMLEKPDAVARLLSEFLEGIPFRPGE